MDLRAMQKPLKERYREDPSAALFTLRARGVETGAPIACSVDLGRAVYEAQAHHGVGGEGTAACSGDLLLGALAACAQLTLQMVATAMGIPVRHLEVHVEGDIDLRGTLGLDKEVGAGFQDIRVRVDVDAPEATAEQLAALRERTERYCTVMRTLREPPPVSTEWRESAMTPGSHPADSAPDHRESTGAAG